MAAVFPLHVLVAQNKKTIVQALHRQHRVIWQLLLLLLILLLLPLILFPLLLLR